MIVQRDDGGGIRVEFDAGRGGWVIQQPRLRIVDHSPDDTDPEPDLFEDWAEVAFVPAWGRQQPGDLPWRDAAAEALSDSD